ncbi:response regulator [Haloferax larsenii]|uniref:Response regulator receiver domain-containing protein n=1 Tax=Haloferax larsenii TaxID=302484 RepID=A0A1H7R5T0_HALLR|nr:HalOD1 output domain-containing protein [Haloferax larsenii]SEL55489.1 Response regulator receiver domain-containing protein [Haloferax larsenii]
MQPQLTVLHADDDPGMLALSRAAFREVETVTLLTAESASEAIDIVSSPSTPVDCVVSDSLVLPNGVSLVEAVREENEEMPIFLFTAKDWGEVEQVATAAGVTEYVQKAGPGDLSTVLQRVRSIVETDDDDVDSALDMGSSAVGAALTEHETAASTATLSLAEDWELIGQWLGDEELGLVIVEAVESYAGLSAIKDPLFESIDTDALESLIRPLVENTERPGIEVRFPYGEFQLAVTSSGDILARPLDDAT